MKRIKQALALLLAVALLVTFTACGKEKESSKSDKGGNTTTTTTTTTLPSDGDGLLPDDERDGSEEHPFEIGGVLEFDAVVKAGGVTHYDVLRVGGTTLTIESADATVTYNGETYEPVDGVISFLVTTDDVRNPIKLAIGNKGAADATFHVTFTYPKGTLLNPHELKALADGEGKDLNVAIEAGNETGVVYTYTAQANGTLTFVIISDTDELACDLEVYNLTSGAIRTMGEDGEKGNLRVDVAKGDQVRITYVVLPNDKNEYPAMTIQSSVCFGEKEDITVDGPDRTVEYTITVKDQNGKPVAGLELRAQVEQIWKTVTTDSKGVAKFVLPEGAPMVKLMTIPEGYIAASNTFWIKAGNPTLAITLEKEQVTPPTNPTTPRPLPIPLTPAAAPRPPLPRSPLWSIPSPCSMVRASLWAVCLSPL